MGSLERVSLELGVLALSFKKFAPKGLKPGELLLFETASPSFKVSWTGLLHDYLSLGMGNLEVSLKVILRASDSHFFLDLIKVFEMMIKRIGFAKLYISSRSVKNLFYKWSWIQWMDIRKEVFVPSPIGQLQTKVEAAGKIRVFAMVDILTQSALKPLHEYLFSFLKSLPNDGTFDQHASVKRCMSKSISAHCSFGYDLSAATDRLPIDLQVSVLSSFLGKEFATAWRDLLINRDYVLVDVDPNTGKTLDSFTSYRYAIGQPMGALSS